MESVGVEGRMSSAINTGKERCGATGPEFDEANNHFLKLSPQVLHLLRKNSFYVFVSPC